MKVYVLTAIWQFDVGDCGSDIAVFDSLDKAKELLNKAKKDAKASFKRFDTEEGETKTSYSIWESGNYCYNHEELFITEEEVR